MSTSWSRGCGRPIRVSNLNITRRDYWWGDASRAYNSDSGGYDLTSPNCNSVNSFLTGKWFWDALWPWGGGLALTTHYYGMVDDGAGFMRGCSNLPGPAFIRSGRQRDLGLGLRRLVCRLVRRTRARPQLRPWPRQLLRMRWKGRPIRTPAAASARSLTGNTAIFGFDARSRAVYPASWYDVMTLLRQRVDERLHLRGHHESPPSPG